MTPVFSVEDLQRPAGVERVLRQFWTALAAMDQSIQTVQRQSIPAPIETIVEEVAPRVRDELQATGIAPLNLQSLLPTAVSSGSGGVSTDTHAIRLSLHTPPDGEDLLYLETDRNLLYFSKDTGGGTLRWTYAAGVYVAGFTSRPSDLAGDDRGLLFYAADQSTIYIWTGLGWDTITRRFLKDGVFAIFDHANTADRTYTFPDASGTLALTSALPDLGPWTVYTPTVASDVGDAAATFATGTLAIDAARYKQLGKTVHIMLRFRGTLNPVTPSYFWLSMPFLPTVTITSMNIGYVNSTGMSIGTGVEGGDALVYFWRADDTSFPSGGTVDLRAMLTFELS